jgi:arylsulfatase A-like enzyme/Flp pilus assembly protein TadD
LPPEKKQKRRRPLWLFRVLIAVLGGVTVPFLGMCTRPETAAGPPDVILITIDTLRADALGFAGNRDVQTPFLDRIASESVVFTNAHAHNVVTLPSHINILTGLYPYQHGVRDNAGYVLDPKFRTLAPLLKERGYATGAFVGAFPLDARYGLPPGFDVYDDRYPEGAGKLDFKVPERSADEVLSLATKWWSEQGGKRFLWIHLYDPHAPYAPPGEFASRYASAPYHGEVAYVDSALEKHLGPLLKGDRETLLVITADHGEALGDHGELTHGLYAYESTLKIPLLVHDPRTAQARVENRPARHIDIAPTILERAGAAKPPELLGQSLLQFEEPDRSSYFESLSASLNRGWAPLVGLIDQGHKYVDLPIPELYDLASDPGETKNLFTERRRVVNQLRKILADSAPAGTAPRNVSPDQAAQLLSLGYVSGNAAKKHYTVADDPKNLIDVDGLIHRMIEAYQLGQLEQALKTAREVVRRQPDMPVGREMLAFMLHTAEQPEAGIATLREAIARGHATDGMKMRLGLMLSESGHAREAVDVLAPYSSSNDVDLLNAYGIALSDLGRHSDAVRQFQRVLEIDATNATAYQNLGIVTLRSGDATTSQQYLAKSLQLDPTLPLALNTLGVIYAQSGRDGEAIEVWRKAIDIDPKLYDAMFNLGVIAGRNQRWGIAHAALTRFIDTAPPSRYAKDLAAAKSMLREVERRGG